MHVQHTILSVATTQGLVCTTHQRSVLYTLLFGCAYYTFMMVCYAHHKRCAYRDIGSTPYLVCCTHISFYSAKWHIQLKYLGKRLRGPLRGPALRQREVRQK